MVAACGGGGGGGTGGGAVGGLGDTIDHPAKFGPVQMFVVNSANTAYNYPISVYLPPQYDANPQARYPVIFAVDGDAQFGYPNNGTRFDALKGEMQVRGTAAILVGVGGTIRRDTDYLPGGSVAFHNFLTKELVPAIDSHYRTDTGKRVLSGLSYGGTIVFLAFTYEAPVTPTFKYFWSIETAAPLGVQLPLYDAEATMFSQVQGRPVPLSLFLVGATGFNAPIVSGLYAQLASRNYTGLDLQTVTYSTTHVGADIPAFDEALTRFGF